MAIAYIRGSFPIWQFIDPTTGLPLNDEYYVSFLENTFPYLPSTQVFHDNQGTTPWNEPIQLNSGGQLDTDLYFSDIEVYRIEVRHGATQNDQLINVVNNFDPGGNGGITPTTETASTQDNQISNPQFSVVNFGIQTAINPTQKTLSITTAGTYSIAPDWNLILTGSGTGTITQLIFSGDQGSAGAPVPPYALRFNLNGWTTAILQQRLDGNGAIWADKFVTASVLARSEDAVPRALTIIYVPSIGTQTQINDVTTLSTGDYAIIEGAKAIPVSTNSTLNDVAYVNINIQLPGTSIIDLSDVQVVGQNTLITLPFTPEPDETIERQTDHLFHYYKEPLARKPIPSYLVGWDFPLNPAQRGTVFSSSAGTNKSFYTWDQTIIFQSANSGIQTSRAGNNDFSISASVSSKAAIIQYLPSIVARELLEDVLSVYFSGYAAGGSGTITIPMTISLWVTTDVSLPSIASNNSLVATLDANGKPATFNGSWTEVAPKNGQEAFFTLAQDDVIFDGWWNNDGNALVDTATYFAIVIGTSTITTLDAMIVRSISLQKGNIATIPAPQQPDEVLRECQHYFEKSYNNEIAIGATTFVGAVTSLMVNGITTVYGIDRPFKSAKITTPTVTWYSPQTGTINKIYNLSATADATVASNLLVGKTSSGIPVLSAPATGGDALAAHYTADSRLGA